MSILNYGLKIEVVWHDDEMSELRLSVSNAEFAGQANFYVDKDELASFAKHIQGFPESADDFREYEFGSTQLTNYGGAKIQLKCVDRIGHLVLQVTVYKILSNENEVRESATIQLHPEPAAIDAFVDELKLMQIKVGELAILIDTK